MDMVVSCVLPTCFLSHCLRRPGLLSLPIFSTRYVCVLSRMVILAPYILDLRTGFPTFYTYREITLSCFS